MRLSTGTTLLGLCSAIACGGAEPAGLFDDRNTPSDASASGGSSSTGGEGGTGGSDSSGGRATNTGGTGVSSGGSANSSGGTSATGGRSSSGGTDGGASDGGASSGGSDADACEPSTWCRDRDKDGHGDPEETRTACEPPGNGWVTDCDDCADGNALVHPGAECQSAGYKLTDGVTLSFDFDCDGEETECGDIVKATGTCGVDGPLSCAGSGYLPNPDRKAADGKSAYCGSTVYRNCVSVALPCVAQTVEKPPVTCH